MFSCVTSIWVVHVLLCFFFYGLRSMYLYTKFDSLHLLCDSQRDRQTELGPPFHITVLVSFLPVNSPSETLHGFCPHSPNTRFPEEIRLSGFVNCPTERNLLRKSFYS